MDVALFLAVFGLALILLVDWRSLADDLIEGWNNFRGGLGGGPPSGMHPSPADDGFVVLRRRRRR